MVEIKEESLIEEMHNLEKQRDSEQRALQEAQNSLDEAKGNLKAFGRYSDATWFAKTKTIIRDKTISIHAFNRKIKEIRSILSRSNPRASYFKEAAKRLLSKEQFEEIEEKANLLMRIEI